jgi:hypothetical protein
VTNAYDQFYKHWRHESSASKFRNEFPYILELVADNHGHTLPPFYIYGTSKGRVLVIRSYQVIFERLLHLRRKVANRGIVLSGQPGTGES